VGVNWIGRTPGHLRYWGVNLNLDTFRSIFVGPTIMVHNTPTLHQLAFANTLRGNLSDACLRTKAHWRGTTDSIPSTSLAFPPLFGREFARLIVEAGHIRHDALAKGHGIIFAHKENSGSISQTLQIDTSLVPKSVGSSPRSDGY
jgi:hypothetical protein